MTNSSRAAKFAALPMVIALAASASAGAGGLDRSFGDNGRVTIRFGDWPRYSQQDLAITHGGKAVLVGDVESDETKRFAVALHHQNGSPVRDFSRDGKVTTGFGTGPSSAYKATSAGRGRILVGGSAGGEFALVRYLPDGRLDPEFGSGGKVVTPITPSEDRILDIERADNGSIMVAGKAGGQVGWAKYRSNGLLNPNFGTGGIQVSTPASGDGVINDVALQPDNKAVVGGEVAMDSSVVFFVARYDTDGSLDDGFGESGRTTFWEDPEVDSAARVVEIEVDGGIVAAGVRSYADEPHVMVARMGQDGAPDAGFGTEGWTWHRGDSNGAWGVAVQPDGKVLVAGRMSFRFGVMRFRNNGTEDDSFSRDGIALKHVFPRSFEGASEVEMQGNKILAAGWAVRWKDAGTEADDETYWAMLRFNQ